MTRIRALANVIRMKQMREEEIQVELNRINGEIEVCTAKLAELEEGIEKAKQTFNERQCSGSLSVEEFSLYCGYFTEMFEGTMRQMKAVEEKRRELEHVRDDLIAVYKDKKVMENLRDRIKERIEAEDKAKEKKEQDYLYISRRQRS